jgi:hypothetical protein
MEMDVQVQTVGLVEEDAQPQCKHHWLISPPSGPTSLGRCKHCGEERYFINSTADWVPDGQSAKETINSLIKSRPPVDDWQDNS